MRERAGCCASGVRRGRRRAVGHDESGLQQTVHLDGELGAREVDLVPQLRAGVGPSVTQQPQ
ncbi:hypothetical protein GCM10010392_12090 [Streptomyces clavifer]|nr:hypothetical protein GCM10010392_12090 [Streptomyces clavifer]